MSTRTGSCTVATPLPRPGPRIVFTPPLSPVEEKEDEVQAQEPETEAPMEGNEEESDGSPQESGEEAMTEGYSDEVASEGVEQGEEEVTAEAQVQTEAEVPAEVLAGAAREEEGDSHGIQLWGLNNRHSLSEWINYQRAWAVQARLFIGNLPTGISQSKFHELLQDFARFGPMVGRMQFDHHRNLDTAFIQYREERYAARAMAAHLAGPVFVVDGRILRVERARGGRNRQLASFPQQQQQQQPVRRPSPQVQYGYYNPSYPAWDINGQPMYPQPPVMPMHAPPQVYPTYMAPPPPPPHHAYYMGQHGNYMLPPNPNHGDGGYYHYGHPNNAATC